MQTLKLSEPQMKQLAKMVALELFRLQKAEEESRTPTEPLLTCRQKAEQLGISPATLRRWVREGKIDAVKQGVSQQAKLAFRK